MFSSFSLYPPPPFVYCSICTVLLKLQWLQAIHELSQGRGRCKTEHTQM